MTNLKLVPRDPTPEMIAEGKIEAFFTPGSTVELWQAMWAAFNQEVIEDPDDQYFSSEIKWPGFAQWYLVYFFILCLSTKKLVSFSLVTLYNKARLWFINVRRKGYEPINKAPIHQRSAIHKGLTLPSQICNTYILSKDEYDKALLRTKLETYQSLSKHFEKFGDGTFEGWDIAHELRAMANDIDIG